MSSCLQLRKEQWISFRPSPSGELCNMLQANWIDKICYSPRWHASCCRLWKFSTYDVCQRALVQNRCWCWFARPCQILARFVFISWFHDLQMQKTTFCLQDSLKTWLVIVVCLTFCWTLLSANWLERKQLLSMPCEFERMCNKADVYSCSKSKWSLFCRCRGLGSILCSTDASANALGWKVDWTAFFDG